MSTELFSCRIAAWSSQATCFLSLASLAYFIPNIGRDPSTSDKGSVFTCGTSAEIFSCRIVARSSQATYFLRFGLLAYFMPIIGRDPSTSDTGSVFNGRISPKFFSFRIIGRSTQAIYFPSLESLAFIMRIIGRDPSTPDTAGAERRLKSEIWVQIRKCPTRIPMDLRCYILFLKPQLKVIRVSKWAGKTVYICMYVCMYKVEKCPRAYKGDMVGCLD